MTLKRRNFLIFLGATVGAVACGNLAEQGQQKTSFSPEKIGGFWDFKPVKGPMPLDGDTVAIARQPLEYARYEIKDDLILPEGYTYDTIAMWGDPLGDSRVGYNNDYLSFVETGDGEGVLTANFEYISGATWMQTYEQAMGKSLPLAEIIPKDNATNGKIDAYKLSDKDPIKAKIREICEAALEDQGMGVIFLKKAADGRWERAESNANRRISGISGIKGKYLKATGPGVVIFQKKKKAGYDDKLDEKILGTFANCAGGTSPWGTVFSAEENFQAQVPEAVYADGSSFSPSSLPFNTQSLNGQGNVLGLAGNKYGYMVEVDPADPNDYGTKHTWLGRYRHEAVAFHAVEGKPLAVYSGCDRRGGHLYKFVSSGNINRPTDKANSRLLEDGMLYAAAFEPDGTGRWIPLKPDTPVSPLLPSAVRGGKVMLPNRPEGGFVAVTQDAEAIAFGEKYKTLGDLYEGSDREKQGAILVDAHFAANAVGATATARPEDTDTAPDGSLYIAYTSGSPGSDGGPDREIFQGPQGEPWEYGWIMHLAEQENDPGATEFTWEMLAMGGEPANGGAGFSNPDNLFIDGDRHIWMVTDISTGKHNDPNDKDRCGCFGNNSIWYIPTSGEHAGNAYLFGLGPMECEICGPFFTRDRQTLFLAIQHPGEIHGIRQNNALETRQFLMKSTDGKQFLQHRQVPLGSNWPGKQPNDPPKPAIVAVRKLT
ncbi:PhoX family protein [Phormidium sp. CCY1219]|uniref:PhoX family protein n=1 Tax=Phormidium sp. CCY1219 TaxID=2886104 RepID=UPI002D1F37B8|nr:alkaline phosphatase PhoX [Phormidium sp. CCY1219]MEB3831325.1 DUF839 domain-containing protein [Phormidium sp. CCY1219]